MPFLCDGLGVQVPFQNALKDRTEAFTRVEKSGRAMRREDAESSKTQKTPFKNVAGAAGTGGMSSSCSRVDCAMKRSLSILDFCLFE